MKKQVSSITVVTCQKCVHARQNKKVKTKEEQKTDTKQNDRRIREFVRPGPPNLTPITKCWAPFSFSFEQVIFRTVYN
jgi:hypothetical protein